MLFMNEYEINDACAIITDRAPEYAPYVRFLRDWRDCVNDHSDGWAHWSGGPTAAKKLMELTQQLLNSFRGNIHPKPERPTLEAFRKSLAPIRATATRRKFEFNPEMDRKEKPDLKEFLIVAVYEQPENGKFQRFADYYSARTPEEAEQKAHAAAEAPLIIAGVLLLENAENRTHARMSVIA